MGHKTRRKKRRKAGATPRRVVLHRPPGKDDFGCGLPGARNLPAKRRRGDATVIGGSYPAYLAERQRAIASPWRMHPIVRLTDDGIDWGATPDDGDEVGYGMDPYRLDDCLSAAIATCTQAPIEQVPDFAVDRRLAEGVAPEKISEDSWDRLIRWADKRDWQIWLWDKDELPVPRRRWIGVVVVKRSSTHRVDLTPSGITHRPRRDDEQAAAFEDHCWVMSHDRIVFDPMVSVKHPPGFRLANLKKWGVQYGLSFEPKEEQPQCPHE